MFRNEFGFKNGIIILDEPKSVYYSGQVILGRIRFEINEPISCLRINVCHLGEANVQWTEDRVEIYSNVKQRRKIYHIGREEYFNTIQCVYGGDGITRLNPGGHTIPFTFHIPVTAPSSFFHDRGHVKYSIIAYIFYEDGSKDQLIKEYKVIAPLNLNHIINDIKKPIEINFEEVYSCNWMCIPRELSLHIHIPMSGYCPGEVMPISITAQNDTNTDINKIMIMLISKERYHSQLPLAHLKPPEEVLTAKNLGPIPKRTNENYTAELKIPDMIAPNLENCGIIDVGFFVKVRLNLSGCNKPMEDESEVRIGLVPLNSQDVKLSHPMTDSLPNSAIPDPTNTDLLTKHQEDIKYASHLKHPIHTVTKGASGLQNPVPSNPYLSIAAVIDKSCYDRMTDLYTSHEVGLKTRDAPHSMQPDAPHSLSPPNVPIVVSQNQNTEYYKKVSDTVETVETPTIESEMSKMPIPQIATKE